MRDPFEYIFHKGISYMIMNNTTFKAKFSLEIHYKMLFKISTLKCHVVRELSYDCINDDLSFNIDLIEKDKNKVLNIAVDAEIVDIKFLEDQSIDFGNVIVIAVDADIIDIKFLEDQSIQTNDNIVIDD